MKNFSYGKSLEIIENKIEFLQPGSVVNVNDLIRGLASKERKKELTEATIMLLKKYGIEYRG